MCQEQGGAVVVQGMLRTTDGDEEVPAAFIKEGHFFGNSIFATFTSIGGGALSVLGKLLVHNSSFDANNIAVSKQISFLPSVRHEHSWLHLLSSVWFCHINYQTGDGNMVRVEGQGKVQLSFCSFNGGASKVSQANHICLKGKLRDACIDLPSSLPTSVSGWCNRVLNRRTYLSVPLKHQ